MKAKTKRVTAHQRAAAMAQEAMPAVKILVKKYGRTAIARCLNNLKEHEKSLSKLDKLKAEVAALERRL